MATRFLWKANMGDCIMFNSTEIDGKTYVYKLVKITQANKKGELCRITQKDL